MKSKERDYENYLVLSLIQQSVVSLCIPLLSLLNFLFYICLYLSLLLLPACSSCSGIEVCFSFCVCYYVHISVNRDLILLIANGDPIHSIVAYGYVLVLIRLHLFRRATVSERRGKYCMGTTNSFVEDGLTPPKKLVFALLFLLLEFYKPFEHAKQYLFGIIIDNNGPLRRL